MLYHTAVHILISIAIIVNFNYFHSFIPQVWIKSGSFVELHYEILFHA